MDAAQPDRDQGRSHTVLHSATVGLPSCQSVASRPLLPQPQTAFARRQAAE
jgi:hypothetical protein